MRYSALKMVFERPRGVRDFGPDEMSARVSVEYALSDVFRSFGYRPILMPTFEFVELFELKSGEDIREHLYVFKDKGGRRLCLRPEATASVARMYASELRSLPKPLRLSYYGPMFRYEEPQRGRYREFWQAGVELFGVEGPEADAEILLMASECLKKLRLKHTLRVSHIGVLRSLLGNQGLVEDEQDSVLQSLDRGDLESVESKVDESFIKLLELRGSSGVVGEALKLVSDKGVQALLSAFKRSLELLDSAGVDYVVDFGMARGLDYYTGMVFDVRVEGLGAQDQVCGGGRYDNLVGLFGGPDTPAVGFAFGVDRLLEAMKEQGVQPDIAAVDVYVIPVSDDVSSPAFNIAADLRRSLEGTVECEISGRKLNKALKVASDTGVRYAVIVGPKELEEESVVLRDMKSEEQSNVKLKELASKIG